ncbi:MAG: lipopolysaccharide biosynthesis protein [Ferruginibacter sp.]
MSLRKKALSGLIWTFAQQFSVQGISFIVSIVLARILLPAEFGIIGMITVFVAVGNSLVSSGLTQSLIRSKNLTQADYSTVFFFNILGSAVVYLIVFFSAPFIADFYKQEILTNILRIFCLSFLIDALTSIQIAKLTKELNFKAQMIVVIPSLIISGTLGIVLAYNGFGVWSIVYMTLAQKVLQTIQYWIRTKWYPSLIFDIQIFKEHFFFGYKLTLAELLDSFFKNIYQIIIGKFFSPTQVGYFTRADTIKQLPVYNISSALKKVTYPLFSSIQDDNVKLKSAYRQVMQLTLYIVCPVLVFMAILGEPLFRFLLTEKWLPAVPYFQILCFAGILQPIHSYNLNILKIKGRSDLYLKLEIYKKIIIVLSVLVSINFGIIGLIWGQLVISVLIFFVNTYYSGRFINYPTTEQMKDIFPVVAFSFVIGVVVYLLDLLLKYYHFHDLMRLIISPTIGVLLYIIVSKLINLESYNSIINILFKRKRSKSK